ncbi:hypothetical protein GGX14DRAFT_457503 [Mycena pura]|uniref:Fucose-specific lectin n=1 Tax=Mycena pura TaxID=153505 RepID=A0AAD6V8Q2_9AGAR|nr:hypothetical protein GGX14DRAFT_457503 [Mycena pura]
MFFTQLLTALYVFAAVRANPLLGNSSAVVPSPDLVPIGPIGNVAAVQIATGNTFIFYQNSTGEIVLRRVTAPFLSGGTDKAEDFAVPASEVLPYTPIVAITANTAATYTGIRLYFFSRENVLSEYTWAPSPVGWIGGPSCTSCLTAQGIVVKDGSQVLYALANPAFNQFRVGFVSAGQPGTISEAENLGGGWGVAPWP